MKKMSQFLLLIFFFIVTSVPVYWLTKGDAAPEVSIIEARILELPEKSYPTLKIALDYIREGRPEQAIALVWGLFTGGSLQTKFDSAARDQFPLRMPLIMFSKAIERQIIQFAYAFTNDTVIPADMTSGIYIILEDEALIYPPSTLDASRFDQIDERLDNYVELTTTYPEINFYIYYLETMQFSRFNPLNKYFAKADNGQGLEYFQSHLTDQINLGFLLLEGFEDHLTNFFRTDHHWNTNGILRGYNGIYQLLSSNYEGIPPMLTPSAMITFPGIEFLGTFARRTLYPLTGDPFTGFEAEFPECKTFNQGIEGVFDHREEYLAGEYSTTPYTSHYGLYFGTQTGMLEFDCETETERNILVIGDSYVRPLIALIATQYDHTYFVDLRQEAGFTLSDFLTDHQVEDILLVGGNEVLFMDTEEWIMHP
jgi:hypothetical protein